MLQNRTSRVCFCFEQHCVLSVTDKLWKRPKYDLSYINSSAVGVRTSCLVKMLTESLYFAPLEEEPK